MSNIFLVLVLLSMLAMILGLIRPSLVRMSSRWKAFGLTFLAMVVSFILAGVTIPKKQPTEATATAASAAKAGAGLKVDVGDGAAPAQAAVDEEATKKANDKRAVQRFGDEVQAILTRADSATAKARAMFTSGGKGFSAVDMYGAAKQSQSVYKSMMLELDGITLPYVSDDQLRKSLKNAKSAYSMSFYSRAEAMSGMMAYLDDKKPSTLQKVKETGQDSENYLTQATLSLFIAQQAVGINMTQGAPDKDKKKKS